MLGVGVGWATELVLEGRPGVVGRVMGCWCWTGGEVWCLEVGPVLELGGATRCWCWRTARCWCWNGDQVRWKDDQVLVLFANGLVLEW